MFMRLVFCLTIFFGAANLAQAQDYPALFDVSGVSDNDVLYIRDKPTTASNIIGAFEYNDTQIEVIREEDGWGLVNFEEGIGWASLAFLAPAAKPAGPLPASCFGTEPFWTLSPKQYAGSTETWLVLEPMGEEASTYLMQSQSGALSSAGKLAMLAENASDILVLTIRRASCGDGMSDRAFGLAAEIVNGNENKLQHLSGCCTLR